MANRLFFAFAAVRDLCGRMLPEVEEVEDHPFLLGHGRRDKVIFVNFRSQMRRSCAFRLTRYPFALEGIV